MRADRNQSCGRYQILKHLASGGMAEVLLARASGIEGFERHVVIKRIHVENAHDQQSIAMFLDEARLAAQLHHHNIVQVYDIGRDSGEYFFAMEYLHGEDLRRLLRQLSKQNAMLPLEHIITIVTSAAAGLHYAHEKRGPDRELLGIVHRDVSPANIFVGYDGEVKVVDFGIAKAALRSAETRSGTLKGKIPYMSPEQCNGQPVDRRSDIFALGIVLYELTTVRRLFKGDSDFLTMTAIVSGKVPSPSQFRPDLPPELEQIILKALALDPADRFQTADELRIALDRLGYPTSTSGLATCMRQQFGTRPEPWLDDDDSDYQVDVDFDGSGSGVARMPSKVTAILKIPGAQPASPILRARAEAMAIPKSRTTAAIAVKALKAYRPWITVAIAGLAALAIAIVVVRPGTGDQGRAAPPEPIPTSAAAPPLAAEVPAEVTNQLPAPPPAEPDSRAAAATPQAPQASTVDRPTKARIKRKPSKLPEVRTTDPKPTDPKKRWDPHTLFPK